MPIYEYRCGRGHSFDVLQRMTDDPVTDCEVCGKPVQRVLHSPAVHFKGSGFYTTDYGKKKRNGAGSGESKEGSGESKEGSGESKKESSSSDSGSSGSDSRSSSKSSDSKPATAGAKSG